MGGTTEFSFTGNEKDELNTPAVSVFIKLGPDYYADEDKEDYEDYEDGDTDTSHFEFITEECNPHDREEQYRIIKEISTGKYWKLGRYFISWDQAGEWNEKTPVQVKPAEETITVWNRV